MLNKKKVIIAIAIVILIILLITGIIIFANDGGAKVATVYKKLSESKEYLFEMNDMRKYEITIAKKGEKTCIDMNNENERVTTIVKDNATYVVSHAQKEYRVYNADVAGETVVTDMLGNLKDVEHTTGSEQINGKNYKYEEYANFAGFLTSTNIEIDESKIKTRFYFDGNNLVYIKTIPEDGNEELLQVKISYEVPDELFEIPSDYAERENTGM